jgi:hypothetical protein
MPTSPIPNVGLGLYPKYANLRGNYNAFKKDVSPESVSIIIFHPVPQEQIHSPPRLSTNIGYHHHRHTTTTLGGLRRHPMQRIDILQCPSSSNPGDGTMPSP